MRMIREVLRLKLECGLSDRQIAKTVDMARSSVGEYLRRFRESGLAWPLPAALLDRELEACLFPPVPSFPSEGRPLPDWPLVHAEMRRKGVTLMLPEGADHRSQHSRDPSGADPRRAFQGAF